ncbi:hypothetical protein NQ314_006924 [Rhamnusium bicolor]|uniref:Uncharacterized protein n=1 Tax=Rhamnusium bicolor TaxID=1586634 RepID=A0AAV8YW45_9CUCU|nr:hypothetical protein NQ314_006924 [Rhamnusium bicolor]
MVSPAPIISSFCLTVGPSLENLVKQFWEVEDLPSSTTVNPDDLECEKIFQTTYRRDSSGRYTVVLPFKIDSSFLGDSYTKLFKGICP